MTILGSTQHDDSKVFGIVVWFKEINSAVDYCRSVIKTLHFGA